MRAAAYLFTGLLVLAALTPVVLGAPERADSRRDAMEHRERPDAKRAEHPLRGNVTDVSFSADGLSRDNQTYALSGLGSLVCKSRENETRGTVHVVCRGRMNATLLDANGTLVKDGTIRVMLHAHKNETGAWTWHLMSIAHGKRGQAVLALHGHDGNQTGDQLSLSEGKGIVIVKKDDERARLRLRLSEGAVQVASI